MDEKYAEYMDTTVKPEFEKLGDAGLAKANLCGFVRATKMNPTPADISAMEEKLGDKITFDDFKAYLDELPKAGSFLDKEAEAKQLEENLGLFNDGSGNVNLGEFKAAMKKVGGMSYENVKWLVASIGGEGNTISIADAAAKLNSGAAPAAGEAPAADAAAEAPAAEAKTEEAAAEGGAKAEEAAPAEAKSEEAAAPVDGEAKAAEGEAKTEEEQKPAEGEAKAEEAAAEGEQKSEEAKPEEGKPEEAAPTGAEGETVAEAASAEAASAEEAKIEAPAEGAAAEPEL